VLCHESWIASRSVHSGSLPESLSHEQLMAGRVDTGPLLAGLAVTAFGDHSATLVGAAALTAIGAYALHRAHRAFTIEAAS
jgi:hypothetical protein